MIGELYLASLNRPPSAAELVSGVEVSAIGRRPRRAGRKDLLWALVNSKAFLYNY